MTNDKRILGILGGSGFYEMDGVKGAERIEIDTPWGGAVGRAGERRDERR